MGRSIDLDAARASLADPTRPAAIRHKRKAPSYFQYKPAPLRVSLESSPLRLGQFCTIPGLEAVLFDFGAVSLAYAFPLKGPIESLVDLSLALGDETLLQSEARDRVQQLLERIESAIDGPSLSAVVEDYTLFQIEELSAPLSPANLLAASAGDLARVLRSEKASLSADEIADATASRLSFGPKDLSVVDWNAAILFDKEAEDVRDVLEFANVQLLEMRFLDDQLDAGLNDAYETMIGRRRLSRGRGQAELGRIGRMQIDAAVLFERVSNALKLLGDQYLARVYRLVAARFSLPQWNASIQKKLDILENLYRKRLDHRSAVRMEFLEWLIVVLIAFELVLSLLARVHG